jgi:plasmid stability protein
MPKMIQLRNVPDALHRRLKARAAMTPMSRLDYLLAETKEIAERATLADLRNRLPYVQAGNVSNRHRPPGREEREAR